jgi:lipid A 3-O-deacylase
MMNIHSKILVSLITGSIAFSCMPSLAQEPAIPDVQEEISKVLKKDKKDDDIIFTLAVENDLFGPANDDNNYTSGVRLSWFKPGVQMPVIFEQLDNYIPTFDVNETTSIYYSLGQNLYTPNDITTTNLSSDERPYAGFLYGSAGLVTAYENHVDEIEATLGVVGPMALGEQTQKLVHKLIDTTKPEGWDYHQLENEPALMISALRRWPEFYRTELPASMILSAAPYGGTTLGNVYTYASTGIDFRLRPKSSEWNDTPMRVRPAMPGSGYFRNQDKPFDWYLFAGLDGRAIARNIFLDGNTFRDSPRVDKKYFVADANAGIAFTIGDWRLSYTLVYRTEEFQTQDKSTSFGAFSLGYRF